MSDINLSMTSTTNNETTIIAGPAAMPNTYKFLSLIEDTKPVSTDHRVIELRFKSTKVKNADGTETTVPAAPPLMVHVEQVKVSSFTAEGTSTEINIMLQDLVDQFQQDAIRAHVETIDQKNRVWTAFDRNTYGTSEGLAELWKNTATSGKLSGSSIEAWFSADLQDLLLSAFIKKLQEANPDAEASAITDRAAAAAADHLTSFKTLANPKAARPSPAVIAGLENAAKLAPDSKTKKQITDKLASMKEPSKLELSLAL